MLLAFVAAACFVSLLVALLAALEMRDHVKQLQQRIAELENPDVSVPPWISADADEGELIDLWAWRERHDS